MRRMIRGGLILALAVICCSALAMAEDQVVNLPDGTHTLRIPAEMEHQEPAMEETSLEGIWLMPPELEMLVFAYEVEDATTARSLAEALSSAGTAAEVREIAGTEFLVFQDRDDADGAPCIGYSYIHGTRMIEISFFYSTQAAMDLTKTIMESFH